MDKTIKISKSNFDLIQKLSTKERRTKKEIINRALENYFKSKKVVAHEKSKN